MAQKLQNKLRIGRQQGILLIMKGVIGILCIILLASTAVMIENLHDVAGRLQRKPLTQSF